MQTNNVKKKGGIFRKKICFFTMDAVYSTEVLMKGYYYAV